LPWARISGYQVAKLPEYVAANFHHVLVTGWRLQSLHSQSYTTVSCLKWGLWPAIAKGRHSHPNPNPTTIPFLKQGFYGKPIGMWGPNPNRNPNYGDPWLWRPWLAMRLWLWRSLAMAGRHRSGMGGYSKPAVTWLARKHTTYSYKTIRFNTKYWICNHTRQFRYWHEFLPFQPLVVLIETNALHARRGSNTTIPILSVLKRFRNFSKTSSFSTVYLNTPSIVISYSKRMDNNVNQNNKCKMKIHCILKETPFNYD